MIRFYFLPLALLYHFVHPTDRMEKSHLRWALEGRECCFAVVVEVLRLPFVPSFIVHSALFIFILTGIPTDFMGVLTLNIECREKGIKKTMQFEPRTLVHDACRLIRDKLGHMPGNPNDYGLFRVEDDPTKCVWMENGRTLEYYLIRNGDTLEYKNKIRPLRVRTLDGGAVKTVFVDESQPVSQLMVVICSKMGIANHEEYSLVRGTAPEGTDGGMENGLSMAEREKTPHINGSDEPRPKQRGLENTFMNTIGRKKERQIQQLRAKLHTDAEINWADHSKTLREQNIAEDEQLTLRRKFFFSDTNVDTRDPVQLNLLYIQCRDGVLRGLHPVSRDTAIKLAALQCYIEYGPYEEGIQRSVDAKNLLPKEYAKAKELEKNIIQDYRELMYEDSAAPKKKYCELCQSLPTYGVTFFLVKEKLPGKNRLIPRLLGVNKDSVMRVDERTKAVLKEWPLEQVRRWAASYKTFTLDFGDYKDGYYSVQTLEGERIGQLIGGYIDIILKKKRIVDSGGIEGDEGATMVEDIVAPAKATLMAHSDLAPAYPAQEGYLPNGTLRPSTEKPAGAPQYGGVSGMIIAQEMPKGERIRYLDARERSQRALIGTIEATIRAVEEAEEEIQKPLQIDLPQFAETQRHWRVEVEKEAVSDRLAAMGAATAEVVQLTAIPEESVDTRVGHAIATIGSNLPEMGRGVRQLAAIMPNESRAGDLMDAARKLCNAFGDFLEKVHPEKQEKRATILSAASRVGELSHDMISTMQEQTEEERIFHEELNRRARAVATNTAQLARPHIRTQQPLDSLIRECADVSRYVSPLIKRIKQHQGTTEAGAQFRAKVGLIHDAQAVVEPATRLVDVSRSSVSHVGDKHSAGLLLHNTQQLSVNVAELRTLLSNVQQLDFGPQLEHSEELIRSLDNQLQQLSQRIRHEQPLHPSPATLDIQQQTTRAFRQQCRLLNSTIAQMVSATHSSESRQIGAAMLEMTQALSDFTDSVEDVASTATTGESDFAGGEERAESLILNALSVVHNSGNVFGKVREQSTAQQLEEAARRVTESLRKTLASLPDNVIVDRAVDRLKSLNIQTARTSPTPSPSTADLHAIATTLTESANRLPTLLHSSAEQNARGATQSKDSMGQSVGAKLLGEAKESALFTLESLRVAQTDPNNASFSQSLSSSVRQFVSTISAVVELAEANGTSAWVRECEDAIQQIHSVRHLFDGATMTPLNVPLNGNSYYESLAEVTNEARNLGDGMNGLAHYARRNDNEQLCLAVRQVANAVCGLAKNAAQSAYLIGVGDPQSEPGRAAIYDVVRCEQSLQSVKHLTEQICEGQGDKPQIINDTTMLASHASVLASICRDASEQSANVGVRSQFVHCAREITSVTATLITAVKQFDQSEKDADLAKCAEQSRKLHAAAENLCKFIDNPDFGALPARISAAGRRAQQPLVLSATKMLDASFDMITTAKSLDENPSDATTWQQIANSSSVVSESIKQLVAAIRDEAPGQSDLSNATNILMQLLQQVDDATIAAAREELPRADTSVDSTHQQILHSAQQIMNSIDPLKISAISHAEAIGRNVRQQIASIQTLVAASVQAASLSYDSRTQSNLFEQCKTVLEASLQMMYATKDSGGNPKAVELHTIVEESAEQQRVALNDLQRQVQLLDSESGVVVGVIDNISRSIALVDQTRKPSTTDSLANIQVQIASILNEMAQNASNAPLTQPQQLGTLSLRLSENYRELVEAVQIAQNLMSSPELSQKLKMSVQKLGTVLIELVKLGAQRRNYPADQRVYQQLSQHSVLMQERIREVLAVLSEGSQGTQACINAAQTVSGIIGDLDTTILFATSGSLNPLQTSGELVDHRDTILKTAKALVEDTKALVSGAASNQEQLAVAAQNAVRTILQLSEAVKCGAATLSSDSTEAQVMVIHAVRDVAAALSNLIQATTHASGRSPNDPAIGNLKEAAKVMVSNVGSLLRAIKTVDDTSQRGAQALEAAINSIEVALKQFESNESTGRRTATAEDVVRASQSVTHAATKAAGASSLLHQENLIAAANLARQSVSDLLSTVRAAAATAENVELKYRMLNSGRDVALQVKYLLATLLHLMTRPDDPNTKNAVLTAANEIAKMVGELARCSEQLRLNVSMGATAEESVIAAGNELIVAANSVEAISQKLAQICPREIHKPDENLTYDEQILSSAKSITQAVQTLVKAASSAQRELVAQGRMSDLPGPMFTSDEQQWTAAANGLVQGHSTEEKLIAAAKQVASSTAHLLVACKVKCDLNSRAMQRLQSAGHAVKTATEHLVNAARQAITQEDCRGLIISQKIVTGITQMMDAHEEVLRKERELKDARNRLAQLNRSRYEKSPELSPEKQ
uniref:Talin n=1 Tax=Globodera rostochiensis TaxID=31243 RepID=A0A914HYR3_GLORO